MAPPPQGTGQAGEKIGRSPLPSVDMPKGGGAIRGIGEKFGVSAATGTGSLNVPLVATKGRADPDPQLSLAYDSGAGNGPFGLGWSLSLPSVTRKTDKGLPLYRDSEEADVFILSGAEDLVPILDEGRRRISFERTLHGRFYVVSLYRPRVEGLFARIERWRDTRTGTSHWRTITRDNAVSIFGDTPESRVSDPDDPRRIFKYLLSLSFDNKGSVTRFTYLAEDPAGVDLGTAHEGNRRDADRRTQRYLKQVLYGNATPWFADWSDWGSQTEMPEQWHFKLVFDYGDHAPDAPTPAPDRSWRVRPDPFSTYRSSFEIRSFRRCERVLLFHHFPGEPTAGADCLVRSSDLRYSDEVNPADPLNPIYTLLQSVTETGYRRTASGLHRSGTPPVEFTYSQVKLNREVQLLDDPESLRGLPEGLDGTTWRWADLDGEGLSGVLCDNHGAWTYKRNLSPLTTLQTPEGDRVTRARLGPPQTVARLPVPSRLDRDVQLLDLDGGGQLDLVMFDPGTSGFYERTEQQDWAPYRPFHDLPRIDWSDPNLQFVDLTGNGLADVLITADNVFTFYPSLGKWGFGPAHRVTIPPDEDRGPYIVFADGTHTVFLADMSGDGLRDLVRVRDGEVCYWPNTGGRFIRKITMDGSPSFTNETRFDPRRLRLADIDGSGTTDLIYVGEDGVKVWFNRSGNGWSGGERIAMFPSADLLSSVQVLDLLGTGTACLVWSSPLAAYAGVPLRYVDLMGSRKPHLLTGIVNNLGAETRIAYAPSTRFYLEDRRAGRPWVTRLPFPVQCVERVEVYDRICRSRFVTRYRYSHAYYDGREREFRGFGMVEQWDTEDYGDATLFPGVPTVNEDAASFVPPVRTRTWFHTGAFLQAGTISQHCAHEYWVEPALRGNGPAAAASRAAIQVPDSVFEDALQPEEMREAYRALKNSPLRVEVYADDRSERAAQPYSVVEHNYTVRRLQPFGPNQHASFLTFARESVTWQYERQTGDPRTSHEVTLETDLFGNPISAASVAYPRRARTPEPEPTLSTPFRAMLAHDQGRLHVGASGHRYTAPVHRPDDRAAFDAYRAPQPSEVITAELTGRTPAGPLFRFAELADWYRALWDGAHDLPYEDIATADIEGVGEGFGLARRVVEQTRTVYRRDDLSGLLPLGIVEPLALPGRSYQLALTPGLLQRIFASDVTEAMLLEGGYLRPDGESDWWIPSGRVFYSRDDADPASELAEARAHFYRPRRAADPFGAISRAEWDVFDVLPRSQTDPVGNVTAADNDYRVLQPAQVTDPNGNRRQAAYDALGRVAGAAVCGKAGEGDTLAGFKPDLSDFKIAALRDDPLAAPGALLAGATNRIVYDTFAYLRTRDQPVPDAPMVYTLNRETHVSDLRGGSTQFQHLFLYCDGFGREAQHKSRAEAGTLVEGGPVVSPRWVGSGWTIYNNKGKPVRQYEPFFSATQHFEFNRRAGVSTVTFYDPLDRELAALHPDGSFEKTVVDAWRSEAWDVNDTALIADPRTDPDVGDFFCRLFGLAPGAFVSWHDRRVGGDLGDDPATRAANQDAARKVEAHAGTPTTTHYDPLGRTCLSVADNGAESASPRRQPMRTAMDAESKPLVLFDPAGRHVSEICRREPAPGAAGVRFVAGYDVAGRPLYRRGMDDGERRTLPDVNGEAIRNWDARGHLFRTLRDPLRRVTHRFVSTDGQTEILVERIVHGEGHPDATRNLRGRVFRHYDGAGVASNDRHDYTGNLQQAGRQLAADYRELPDWSAIADIAELPALDLAALDAAAAPLLDPADHFTSLTTFDALNRPIQSVLPHAPAGRPSVIRTGYNEATLLDRIDVWVRQLAAPRGLLDPAGADLHAVINVDYNARGQRLRLVHGNGATTRSQYDPETFRLASLVTLRPSADPDARSVQVLSYTYDPKGNITQLRDDADLHDVVFFRNRRVDPTADYTYDARYRLLRATGREHLGLSGGGLGPPVQVTNDDGARIGLPLPDDGRAMAVYTERYDYDPSGNLLQMVHQVASGGWTRRYAYAEPSLISAAETSNRLSATSRPGDLPNGPYSDVYRHDAHGNMTRMPHLTAMRWDVFDHLQSSTRQHLNAGTPVTTWYAYADDGERLRKVTDREAPGGVAPTRRRERIYLGGIEIFRQFGPDGTTVSLERETLHVTLDGRRVALAETRTIGDDPAPEQLVRYQFANHLGSALLELDDGAAVISYEEYFPYGATSLQLVRGRTETPKRYRYTGKERDEENDLDYHGARYCAPWLGRWIACDPAGTADGPNLYMYVNGNPVAFSDPTGMWGWREVAIVAAVVVVGTLVTVATAGVAGPIVAGAVASIGLSGAAATVATGVVVGAVAGAAGGAAGELTRQVGSGEEVSGGKILHAAEIGAALGGVTGGIGAAASTVRGAAAIARASTAVQESGVGRTGAALARTVAAGGRAVARIPGVQGAADAIGSVARGAGRALQAVEAGGQAVGGKAAGALFQEGSAGATAAPAYAATRSAAAATESAGSGAPAKFVADSNLFLDRPVVAGGANVRTLFDEVLAHPEVQMVLPNLVCQEILPTASQVARLNATVASIEAAQTDIGGILASYPNILSGRFGAEDLQLLETARLQNLPVVTSNSAMVNQVASHATRSALYGEVSVLVPTKDFSSAQELVDVIRKGR